MMLLKIQRMVHNNMLFIKKNDTLLIFLFLQSKQQSRQNNIYGQMLQIFEMKAKGLS